VLLLGLHPVQDPAAPGRGGRRRAHAPGAREALDGGPVDVAAALAWRDFMVSDHTDAGAAGWLEDKGIDLHRGSATFTGPGRIDVAGVELTADDIVVATGRTRSCRRSRGSTRSTACGPTARRPA
jgi:pyruvate/2-oxoglutarate dehydrogenase complex dihydrolipoamide dehydrogenase (E3) component